MYILESHHQCPDCFSFDLSLVSLEENSLEFELFLNYHLAIQEKNILDGKVKFSLRNFVLEITLKSAEFVSFNENNVTKLSQEIGSDNLTKIKAKIDNCLDQQGETVNTGSLKLGVIRIKSEDYCLDCSILASKSNLYFKEVEGLWTYNITPNKHAVLERKLADLVIFTYLQSYVSRVIVSGKNQDYQAILPSFNDEEIESYSQGLKKLIQVISQTTQDDFLTLTKIAHLNPLTDFIGANLVGVNLSGLNLSSGNFRYGNFRGADLTDTDLSDANLENARLNGADLSGAYLEGVNLRFANLTNASLALSNLMGADLTNANLTKTNLQNTSLAKVTVKNTVFADNPGLTDDKIRDLILQGAIFPPQV